MMISEQAFLIHLILPAMRYIVCLKVIEYVLKKFWRVQNNELEKIDLNWPVWLCLFND